MWWADPKHYLVTLRANDRYGLRLVDVGGLALHRYRICATQMVAEMWLEKQQRALMETGWRLSECSPVAETFDMTAAARKEGTATPSHWDRLTALLARRRA